MGKIMAIANQKGGVGKTTTSINLAAGLAFLGKKILLIDLDPQANATQGLGARNDNRYSTHDLLINNIPPQDCVKHLKVPPMDIIPATIDLAGADIELSNYSDKKQHVLKNQLALIKDNYDFIIIDCPPALGLLNTNALTAADSVIVPVQCEYYALEGLTQLLSTIKLVQELFNPKLHIEGVLLTMFDIRNKLSTDVQQEVRKYFKETVYNISIPRNVKLSEAPSHGKCIFEYDVKSSGSRAYVALAKEVLERNSMEVI